MAYLGASKNKKHQENLGFYKPNFLGISYFHTYILNLRVYRIS